MTDPFPRRAIARELSRVVNAPVGDVLAEIGDASTASARRIGITGPPGGGKSTLISALAAHRLEKNRDRTVAVLAIDPTSPLSGGSILGDRIRMDAIADLPRLFIRSVPSRGARNGLCDNVVDLMTTLERHRFEEILLETVGIGQAEIDVRELVDTVVLVVPPDAGDSVQAMKAGIIEIADIFVVTKSENPAARQMAAEIRGIVGARKSASPPAVVMTAANGSGIAELSDAIDAHHHARDNGDTAERRRHYHLKALIGREIDAVLSGNGEMARGDLRSSYNRLLQHLRRY
ncbi:GTP-binding protein [Pararhizobium haloflavum]|uniref:GTP-binding protein n=1 Tax=Pararhizobium haloflavum TaxID=2037914 RepID=UPI000C1906FD|nr:GTP-binding protein [Pararhizobium haloflavum]